MVYKLFLNFKPFYYIIDMKFYTKWDFSELSLNVGRTKKLEPVIVQLFHLTFLQLTVSQKCSVLCKLKDWRKKAFYIFTFSHLSFLTDFS